LTTRARRLWNSVTDGAAFPYVMILPAIVVLAVIVVWPLFNALILSFQDFILTRPNRPAKFGLQNYGKMLADAEVWGAVLRSVIYMLGTVVGAMVLGTMAALLTRKTFFGRGLARLMFILPWAIPAVAAALVWGVMYDVNFGVLNRLIALVFPGASNVEWLVDRDTALPSLIAIQVWNEFPIAYMFLLAGLQTVDPDLYKAARIDGASGFQQFLFVTLPQMRYVAAVTAILLSIFSFKSFTIIFVLTGGGPANRTETLVVQTWNEAFRSYNFSYSATLAIFSVVLSFLLVLVYIRLTVRPEGVAGRT
jgi:multiple sugar transport system permease protein